MAKLKNPLSSLSASGSISSAITFLKRMRHQIAEKKPEVPDSKSPFQLQWRHMFQKAIALWHALSAAEKAEWESTARPKHMTGYAWFISQALRPNPGIYLPLQGGTMAGIIQMNGYPIQTLKDPVGAQDGDTKAARDAAIAAAIGGSLTCDIYGYDGLNWQKLRVESAAQHNLRVRLFAGANAIYSQGALTDILQTEHALLVNAILRGKLGLTWSYIDVREVNADNVPLNVRALTTLSFLHGFDGSTWDRLRTYGTGVLKVGRAEVGLSDLRRVGVGQVKAAPGKLYWLTFHPSGANAACELCDDLVGAAAVKWDWFCSDRHSHQIIFDPPLEFTTGIYLKTIANITSIIFGYL